MAILNESPSLCCSQSKARRMYSRYSPGYARTLVSSTQLRTKPALHYTTAELRRIGRKATPIPWRRLLAIIAHLDAPLPTLLFSRFLQTIPATVLVALTTQESLIDKMENAVEMLDDTNIHLEAELNKTLATMHVEREEKDAHIKELEERVERLTEALGAQGDGEKGELIHKAVALRRWDDGFHDAMRRVRATANEVQRRCQQAKGAEAYGLEQIGRLYVDVEKAAEEMWVQRDRGTQLFGVATCQDSADQ